MSTVDTNATAIDTVAEGIDKVDISDNNNEKCASCGKEGKSEDMNTCNKCKMVKYCNAACKKKHRSKHKKACERRVAELHEEALFKEVERDECPICFLPMPIDGDENSFKSCCGKTICNGCIYAMRMSEGKQICAFCRTPTVTSDEEFIKQLKKLINNGNAEAFNSLAGYYSGGNLGVPQDHRKASELYLKGGELGCANSYFNLGVSYYNGWGVENDLKKAKHYWELAAMGGDVDARHNLGAMEGEACNVDRAIKHLILAARAGDKIALDAVKEGLTMDGLVTKDEYASTLRAYHERQTEMRSDARNKAAASGFFE